MTGTQPDVPVNVPSRLDLNGQDQLAAAFRHDPHHPRPEVHIGRLRIIGTVAEPCHALQPHPGVQEQPDDGEVTPVAEVLAGAVGQQAPHVVIGKHGDRFSGIFGGRIFARGDPLISPASSSQPKSC